MKDYIDYIKDVQNKQNEWYHNQKNEWWKNEYHKDEMDIKGDYLETVKIKSNDEKNDASLFTNHTNVKNSEWNILFHMFAQHLIDWCISHKKNVYSCLVKINRIVDGLDDVYDINVSITTRDADDDIFGWKHIDDPEFNLYGEEVCDMLDRFLTAHKNDLPIDWNYFAFSLDCLDDSCECGEWCPASDGCMMLGNDDGTEYDEYVYCM